MLPSVGAGSAALTKYAQAAVTAAESTARDARPPAGHDQEAGARRNGRDPAPLAADALARESRAIAAALLDQLRQRVLASLVEAGLPENVAVRAAEEAVAVLANSIADNGENAARIVQAALERLQSGAAAPSNGLLSFAARGLVVAVDTETGAIDVTPPQVGVRAASTPRPADIGLPHLLDVTDGDEKAATPLAAAFAAIRAAAAEAPSAIAKAPSPVPGGLAILPDAFAAALGARLAAVAPNVLNAHPDASAAISRVIVRAIAATAPPSERPAPGEISRSIAALQPAAPGRSTSGDVRLESDGLSVRVRPSTGAVTVRVGQTSVAFAPASLPANAELPGTAVAVPLEVASRPVDEIASNFRVGPLLDRSTGLPFVPPAISDLSASDRPISGSPAHRPEHAPLPGQAASAVEEAELFGIFEKLRTAAVLRSVEATEAAETGTGISRFTFDIAAEIGDAVPSAAPVVAPGRFGRSRPAPAVGDPGPNRPDGHTDAATTKPPLLPAWHAAGLLPGAAAAPAEQPQPVRRKKRPSLPYRHDAADDALTREMPQDFEGVVYASVFVSV